MHVVVGIALLLRRLLAFLFGYQVLPVREVCSC